MTAPALTDQSPVPVARVLKRDRLTLRAQQDDRLVQLRQDMDAEVRRLVSEQVAAVEAAYRDSHETAHVGALERAAHSLDAATAALPAHLSQVVDTLADDLIETAAALAEWLCGTDGAASAHWTAGLSDRIADALSQLTAHETAAIRINPDDAAALADARHPALGNVDLHPDPTLQPGEALIETSSGDVDLTLRMALRRAVEIVTGRAAAALTDHRDPGKQRRATDADRAVQTAQRLSSRYEAQP
ncbi:MAG TPA: FliH/SctL family protein [Mycobacteriales bacterium]|nr:FliH/SctL family protein [Mycobacteriales bacterium]